MTIGLTEQEIRSLLTTPELATSLQQRYADRKTEMTTLQAISLTLQASVEITVRLVCANNACIEGQLRDYRLIP